MNVGVGERRGDLENPLNILLVEDSEIDARFIIREIERAGYKTDHLRVDTPEEMQEALEKQAWDIIISDYVMPQFSGLAALEILKARELDLPFIIVSGHIGEEIAVASMKAGAHDYVMKDNLARLVPAIERELREAEVRRLRRASERALRESEERFRQLAEHIDVVFFLSEELEHGTLGHISYVSPAYAKIFGSTSEALLQDPLDWLKVIYPEDNNRVRAALANMSRGEFNELFRIILPEQSIRWIHYRTYPVRDDRGKIYRIAGLAEDITERVEAQEKLEANAKQLQRTNEELFQAREFLEKRVAERTAALQNANAELKGQINARKRLENELLEIAEKERRRIGIDLHDELGQHLNGVALMLKGLELKLEKRGLPEAAESAKIQGLIFKTIQQAKAVARDLASPDVETDDLASALQALQRHVENMFQIECRLAVPEKIPPYAQATVKQVYKIAQEAITNAIKHGKAKEVEITLAPLQDALVLTIRNDGLPFPSRRIPGTGMGLRIMEYRASVVGGVLTVGPGPESIGTVVNCSFPQSREIPKHPEVASKQC